VITIESISKVPKYMILLEKKIVSFYNAFLEEKKSTWVDLVVLV
jgi:hypothetical protein